MCLCVRLCMYVCVRLGAYALASVGNQRASARMYVCVLITNSVCECVYVCMYAFVCCVCVLCVCVLCGVFVCCVCAFVCT